MLNGCTVGEHQYEYWQEKEGVTSFKCKSCGDITTQYQDCGSGC